MKHYVPSNIWWCIFSGLIGFQTNILYAQTTFPEHTLKISPTGTYALQNATICTAPGKVLQRATLLIKNGKVSAVGTNVSIPSDAIVVSADELFVYPAFIELYSDYGVRKPERTSSSGRTSFNPQLDPSRSGAFHWNDAIKPETQAAQQFEHDEKKAKDMREAGFGAVLTHSQDGIARGTGALVLLDDAKAQESLVRAQAAHFFSFSKGISSQAYPSSLMGVIALLRQTHYDAEWYKAGGSQLERNLSLEAWNNQKSLPAIFEPGGDKLNVLRVASLGKEMGISWMVKGNGDEYQRAEEIRKSGVSLILPVLLPEAYDVSDPFEATYVSLEQMMHWEYAPHNPRLLRENKIPFCFTGSGLKKVSDLHTMIGTMVRKGGLKEADALEALTTAPAKMIGQEATMGKLEAGYIANVLVTSGPLFAKETKVLQTWVGGKPYIHDQIPDSDLRGNYSVELGTVGFDWEVTGSRIKQEHTLTRRSDSSNIKPKLQFTGKQFTFVVKNLFDTVATGSYRFQGSVLSDRSLEGLYISPDGSTTTWKARRQSATKQEDTARKKAPVSEFDSMLSPMLYPFMAYGNEVKPALQSVVFRNATVWTNEADGIRTKCDVWIEHGKIKQVAPSITAPGIQEIDATGKHLTSGILDEHSHIAIARGVNEGGQMNSAEVRIGDVVNSEDINLYRQLAGGVVGAQLLHGSANAVGGQSALVKFKWGAAPEAMKIPDADGFIKFALGENPKSSNSGSFSTQVFPQTRMGIEQLYYDAFGRAITYANEWKTYNARSPKTRIGLVPPRRDLELDAMLEILEKKRFISCHSYVQSEIAMLMKVGDSLGFKVNTFTHILEGYKVAEAMKKHGVHASSFADWWAYKWEVKDAIPYNMAILTGAGVTTSVNSDDAEMARRLNQEAAKGVKYGNMSEEEAWKMATLNPAKMLHLDTRTGSIKAGKDADLVLWDAHPMSIYARPLQTWVEGVRYFDREEDRLKQKEVADLRARLIQKLLKAKEEGAALQKPATREKKHHYHCDHEHDEGIF